MPIAGNVRSRVQYKKVTIAKIIHAIDLTI